MSDADKLAHVEAEIRSRLSYCKTTGRLTWVRPSSLKHSAGDEAGSISSWGYRQVQVAGRVFRVHRIAWFLAHGEWPDGMVDHINGIGTDNRICNLRLVDNRTNCENKRKAQSNSRTGTLGVSVAPSGRFCARIGVRGKKHFLGTFDSVKDAQSAYLDAKRKMHKGCTL